jgi:hypothetical protein
MTERCPVHIMVRMSFSMEPDPGDAPAAPPEGGRGPWRHVLVAAAVLALGGCGGGGTAVPATSGIGPTSSAESPSGPAASAAGSTEATGGESAGAASGGGTVVVGGQSHSIDEVRSCAVGPDMQDGSLDLAAIGDGGALQLLITLEFTEQLVPVEGDGMEPKVLQTQNLTLQGPAANGLWSGYAAEAVIPPNFSPVWTGEDRVEIDGPPISVAGDHVSGMATLNDATGGPGTVDLSVDISVPAEAIDCSL